MFKKSELVGITYCITHIIFAVYLGRHGLSMWWFFVPTILLVGGVFLYFEVANLLMQRDIKKRKAQLEQRRLELEGWKIRKRISDDEAMLKLTREKLCDIAKSARKLHKLVLELQAMNEAQEVKNFQDWNTALAQNIALRDKLMQIYRKGKFICRDYQFTIDTNKKIAYL